MTKLNCDGPLNGVLIRNMALLPLNSFRNSKVIILIYVQENFMRNNWDKISLFFFRHLFLKKNASRPPLEFKELYVLAVNDIKIFKHKN